MEIEFCPAATDSWQQWLCARLGYKECRMFLLLATQYSLDRYISKFTSIQKLSRFFAGRVCINLEVLYREILPSSVFWTGLQYGDPLGLFCTVLIM